MSYEKDYSEPYRAECACGQGYLRFYRIHYSNDWGQEKESDTTVELFCDCCKSKYHYECTNGDDYLVPNDLSFPKKEPKLDMRYYYNERERLIQKYNKNKIEAMIADMTAPKHTYMKDLENEAAIDFANQWFLHCKKRSLSPMIRYLKKLLCEYDSLKISYEQKKPFVDKYNKDQKDFYDAIEQIKKHSVRLSFSFDHLQDKLERERVEKERKAYEEEHRYDDFTAQVRYDDSYKKNFVNHYWDSYYIKECTDSQYLILDKSKYGMPQITISKKYACICQICGNEKEILSSDMRILYKDEYGYYPQIYCDCHTVSSFEAKTMDILNQLGITYIREKSFEGLIGDSDRELRFDFALYQSYDESGSPIVDLVIELQGPHHYKEGYYDEFGDYITDDKSKNTEENFTRQLRYDARKQEYCLQHGIKLEYIKYTISNDYEQLEKKVIEILKKYRYKYFGEN